MKRSSIQRRTPMPQQRKPLPRQSAKAKKRAPLRAALVADLLAENPWCSIQWDDGCQGRAVDVDERLGRGVGGDPLDRDVCQVACRHCHTQKHLNPTEAERRGFTAQRRHLPPDTQERAS